MLPNSTKTIILIIVSYCLGKKSRVTFSCNVFAKPQLLKIRKGSCISLVKSGEISQRKQITTYRPKKSSLQTNANPSTQEMLHYFTKNYDKVSTRLKKECKDALYSQKRFGLLLLYLYYLSVLALMHHVVL